MRNILFALVLSLFSFSVFAQSTLETLHGIVQTNCATVGCHDGSSASFNVGSTTDFYNAMVNIVPSNASASAKGNKLVDPGHPYNSFLLRKIGSNGFDAYIQIDDSEKSGHPTVALADYEIELMRQWIMAGAPQNGNVVDYNLIKNYYQNGGLPFIPVPAAPHPSEGIQVRMGPIFLSPDAEFEYMKREDLHNPGQIKVAQMNGYMAWQSHHMLLFKQTGNGSVNGLRRVPFQDTPFNNGILTGAWQNDGDFELPAKTAFYWDPNTILDFDYHIKNYSDSEILPADFYLNIMYSTEENPIEMHAALENNIALVLFEGENVRTSEHIPGGNGERHIYTIASHTHKYGSDYDIYLRNPDGSKGEQIYEGFYNEEYTFNQGYYDYDHPPTRYFRDSLKTFKESDGLIYEVKWDVEEPLVTFGLTTDGEMMLFTYMYTTEKLPATSVGIRDVNNSNESLTVYPNPFQQSTDVRYSLEKTGDVQVEVFDMLGKRVAVALDAETAPGSHNVKITDNMVGNRSGVYFVTLTVDGHKVSTGKITKL